MKHGISYYRPLIAVAIVLAVVVLSACGGGGDDPNEEIDREQVEAKATTQPISCTSDPICKR